MTFRSLLFVPLLALVPCTALANSVWTEDCNLTPKNTFALNEIVCGQGDVDSQCNGSIIGAADIWVVPTGAPDFTLPTGATPKHIVTAGGAGGFWGEILWLPDLVPGQYDLLMDEDCDGQFDVGQDLRVLNAFTVLNYDTGVDIDVTAIKVAAAAEAQRWLGIKNGWDLTLAVLKLWNKANVFASAAAGNYTGLIKWIYGKATGLPTSYNGAVLQVGTRIIHGVTDNMMLHWILLAADPPDADFEPLVLLDWTVAERGFDDLPAYPFEPQGTEPAEAKLLEVAGLMAQQAVLGDAFIRQFEKYQGADAAETNSGIHTTAQRVEVLASAMVDHFDAMETELTALDGLLAGEETSEFMNDPAEFLAIQDRLTADWLDADEQEALAQAGVDPVQDFVDATLAQEVPPEPWSARSLVQDMLARVPLIRGAYQDVATQAAATVAAEAPYASPNHPVADAGGPYSGVVGQPLVLWATGSTDPNADALTYGWDLNADGDFTDASGASPSWEPETVGQRLIGVLVSDPAGNQAVAYSRVTVAEGNLPPVIGSFTPETLEPQAFANQSVVEFTVMAEDPEGDALTYEWTVDGVVSGAGLEFTYTPDPTIAADRYVRVQVRVADEDPLSRDAFEQRDVLARPLVEGDDDDDATDDDDASDDDDDDDASGDDDDDAPGGCACSDSGGQGSGAALLLVLGLTLGLRRRSLHR